MTIFRFEPTYIKGRKPKPVRTFLWNAFAVAAVLAFLFAPPYLAQELYGAASPSRAQIKEARAIICAAILAPFAILFALMWWRSRGADGTTGPAGQNAPLDNPSKRSRVDP
jgi:hypothetical protein